MGTSSVRGHLARGALVVAQQHDALEVGDVLLLEHGRVVDAEEAAHREQGTGARPGEHVGGLGALEAGVERHQGGARSDQTQRGDDPLGHVGGPHRHPVAGVDAGRHGGAGHPQGVAFELGEAQPDVAVGHGFGVPEPGGGVGHQAGDRAPAQVAAGILGFGRSTGRVASRTAGRIASRTAGRIASRTAGPGRSPPTRHRLPLSI